MLPPFCRNRWELQSYNQNMWRETTPSYDCGHLVTNIKNARTILDQYGVAIIPDVLTADECKQTLSDAWDYFENASRLWDQPISRTNIETWRKLPSNMWMAHGQLLQRHGCNHSQCTWNIRQKSTSCRTICETMEHHTFRFTRLL